MANKKRKTLQIKRPDSKAPSAKKKTLPKVDGNNETTGDSPKTAKVARPSEGTSTTRVELPNEEKIRKAREAQASQDLEKEGAIPGADQVEQAQGNATMPIVIDSDSVGDSEDSIPDGSGKADNDQTMQIDADALEEDSSDQTMQIDPSEVTDDSPGDTMEVTTGPTDTSDQTMQIDPSALEDESDDTEEEVQQMETMKMDTMNLDDEVEETEEAAPEMDEAFNAQTMAMDPELLEKEMAASTSKQDDVDEDSGATMDLSKAERPKTIMIKRPSRDEAAPNAPTVKTSRPAPGSGPRPVTAHQTTPKEGTSRIDVPAGSPDSSKEGKTIKLRRPSGAPSAASSKATGVASRAGLDLNADGSISVRAQDEKPLGGGWLAVAIVTFLISCGALWVVIAPSQPELPMAGRLVDVNNQVIAP